MVCIVFINGFMPLSYYRQEAFCKPFLYYFYWWYSMWKDLVLLYFQCEIILFLSLQNRVLTIVNRSVHYCRLFCLQQSAALLTVVGTMGTAYVDWKFSSGKPAEAFDNQIKVS